MNRVLTGIGTLRLGWKGFSPRTLSRATTVSYRISLKISDNAARDKP
jgi:hypothetical protein